MQTIVKFLLAIVALAQAQQQLRGSMPAQSNPGAQPGTGYYWPRYPYTNDDIRKDSELTLQNNYVCKWDVTLDGIGQGTNQGILYPRVLPRRTRHRAKRRVSEDVRRRGAEIIARGETKEPKKKQAGRRTPTTYPNSYEN